VSRASEPRGEAGLDDAGWLERADPGAMLRAVASGAAQVREAAQLSVEAGVDRLTEDGRPRSVVVCGVGGSGIAGDVLAAVAGPSCPVPVLTHRGFGLPSWVGAADLVVAVSCSGATEETLSGLEEAVRRGCRLLVVAATGSPAEQWGRRGRAVVVPVSQGRQPRASLWALATPLILAADRLGLVAAPPDVVEAAAVVLEAVAERCRIDADIVVNPAKTLAGSLSGALPVVWGTSPLSAVAAYRFACQLNENAKRPAVWGAVPEAGHNQVMAFEAAPEKDVFHDPFHDPFEEAEDSGDAGGLREAAQPRRSGAGTAHQHVVLLRDSDEHPRATRRADVLTELARDRGLGVSALVTQGSSSFERLASLIGLTDYASVYLALLEGTDPTPVGAIAALKARLAP
jgi:glucose/mannose-6-phosphate isomerase